MEKKENLKKAKVSRENNELYYVGIGASAGGLEALEELFETMPIDTGMSFVVIQHLSPDYKSLMSELLSRRTRMAVIVAENGMQAKPNTVYLNSPGNDLTIKNGKFIIVGHTEQKLLNLPINLFFRSLAKDQGKCSIGIILSGTGSDGTLGVRAIKEAGGMIMAQDDRSAKFDGMPRSSISTGLVDFVLPPREMGQELIQFIKHPYIKENKLIDEVETEKFKSGTFTRILLLLRTYCGVDFSLYKENTIIRRLERRVSVNRLTTLEEYYQFLKDNDLEKEMLYKELLIGVTNFFRDRDAFASLLKNVIPNLDYHKKSIRIWCAACSTGEEAYSIAMLIKDYIDKNNYDCDVKLFATDIERESLDFAGKGIYSESLISDIEPEFLERYFIVKDHTYQIKEEIRNMIVFASHNVLKDPPFSKLDLLVCRNLFIYLRPELQQKLLGTFYYSLAPKGYLFMGSSESIGEMSEAYDVVDNKWKIYHCKENYHRISGPQNYFSLPDGSINEMRSISAMATPKLKLEKIVEAAATAIMPPSILVDSEGNIVHVINKMDTFLSIRPGRFSSSILNNISSDLALFVSSILRRLKDQKASRIRELISGLESFPQQRITLSGYTIEIQSYTYYLFSFEKENDDVKAKDTYSVNPKDVISKRIEELEKELQVGKENLQATVEELETSNEELQSSNEELIASNEELQSTNEELQSVNEELYTVNSEYQYKIEELTCMTEDLDNLLINADIGALYLDNKLCIRKITPIMSKITNVMNTDIGRPIYHISFMDAYKDFAEDVREVLETLQPIEKEIIDVENRVWLARTRPYRTNNYAVDGVLLTFVEITRSKLISKELDEMTVRYEKQGEEVAYQSATMERMLEGTPYIKLFVDSAGIVQFSNQNCMDFFSGLTYGKNIPEDLKLFFKEVKRTLQGSCRDEIILQDSNEQKWLCQILMEPSFGIGEKFCGVMFTIILKKGLNDNG